MFSCGKETQSSTQGGGIFNLKLTIDPPLQFGKNASGQINTLLMQTTSTQKQWSGNNVSQSLSQIISDDVSVTSAQNVFCLIQIINGYDNICRTVVAEAVQNGKVIKTFNLELGFKDATGASYCTDGYQTTKNVVIQ